MGTVVASSGLMGFTLQGPLTAWMTPRLGYDLNSAIYGGPMSINEEYRWNVPTVYYSFSPDFLSYFGLQGAAQIDQAFAILNALPPASQINPRAYPLTSQRVNYRAMALGLFDVKSSVLSLGLEQMGLADPTRYVFTLRNRWTTQTTTNYYIIRRNYDPFTLRASSFINGVLWTYPLVSDVSDSQSFVFTQPVDPTTPGYLNAPVVSGWIGYQLSGGFWTTLTRDDAGGLKYIYDPSNYNTESYGASVVYGSGGPWGQPGGTNATATNLFVNNSLRPGREKITFQRVDFESLLGYWVPFTNSFTDTYITNNQAYPQYLQRAVAAPDILFHAADLQGGDGDSGFTIFDYAYTAWTQGGATNTTGGGLTSGPGTIGPGDATPAFTVTFNSVGEMLWNTFPIDNQDELTASRVLLYGSFDGSTNDPVIYPLGIEARDVDALVLQAGAYGNPWGPPPLGAGTGQTNINTNPGGGGTPVAP